MHDAPGGNRCAAGIRQDWIGQVHLYCSFLSLGYGIGGHRDNLGTGISNFLIIRLQLTELRLAIPSVVCAVKDDENILLTLEALDVDGRPLYGKTRQLRSHGWRLQTQEK